MWAVGVLSRAQQTGHVRRFHSSNEGCHQRGQIRVRTSLARSSAILAAPKDSFLDPHCCSRRHSSNADRGSNKCRIFLQSFLKGVQCLVVATAVIAVAMMFCAAAALVVIAMLSVVVSIARTAARSVALAVALLVWFRLQRPIRVEWASLILVDQRNGTLTSGCGTFIRSAATFALSFATRAAVLTFTAATSIVFTAIAALALA